MTTKNNKNGNGELTSTPDFTEEVEAQLGMLCQVGMDKFIAKVEKLKNIKKLKAIEVLAKDIGKKKLYNIALRRRISL